MAKFSDGAATNVGKIHVQGRGVTGDVREGIPTTRGGGPDRLDAHLNSADGFVVHASFSIEVEAVQRGTRGSRGTHAGEWQAPAVLVDRVDAKPGEIAQVGIVEDGGCVYIVRPNDDDKFEIPVGDEVGGQRAVAQFVGRIAVRIVGLVAKKAVEKGVEYAIQKFEATRRPYRLRSFTIGDHSGSPERTAGDVDLGGGPALLLIHGVNSDSSRGFRLDATYLTKLNDRYGGRIAAFDHPTLSVKPRANAERLAEALDVGNLREVDILAHSRGGLVARELLDVLGSDSDRVRSVVFAATPNNGTPLADPARIDAFLSMAINVTAVIPDNPVTDAVGIALEVLRELVSGIESAIDGVTCMKPDDDRLLQLSEHSPGQTTFRAIASHYEPRSDDGPLRRAADFAMDSAFRGAENDMLVPTRSTYLPDADTGFHVPVDQRLVLAGSFGVSHCAFWPERRVLRQLDQWLDPAIDIDAAAAVEPEHTDATAEFEQATRLGLGRDARKAGLNLRGDLLKHVSDELGGALDLIGTRSRDESDGAARRGTVVLLPGILGSRLRVADADSENDRGELVWLNKWALIRGRFRRMRVGDERYRVTADGVMLQYGPLFTHLATSWDAHAFAYDWRLSIDDLTGHLADFLEERQIDIGSTDHPVHLVGHSMGGLVARAFIAENRTQWTKGTGRLIQLGTPNWGSFSMVAAALGDEFAVRALAAADVFGSKDEILQVFRSFPSIYDLFPSALKLLPEGDDPPPHARLYEGGWAPTAETAKTAALLAAATDFHTNIHEAGYGDERFVFVAGDDQPTPYRARIGASGDVSFGVTRRGDGRVAHDFGYEGLDIGEERTFFAKVCHGDLASDPTVISAIDELLETGSTSQLATTPAGGVRGATGEPAVWIKSAELEHALGLPVSSTARGDELHTAEIDRDIEATVKLYLGGGDQRETTRAALRVSVVHGSMEQARYAVAAGRYKGIPIQGALAYLNGRLDGALRDLQDLDRLPEDAGTARFVPARDAGTWPRGAIVIGLGEFGQLSATRLSRAMEAGTIEYALSQRSAGHTTPALGVSSVLIGTPGRYGLSVQGSILAIVQGVARASARLNDTVQLQIGDLEIIELYEGRAEEAALAVARLARTDRFDGMDVPIIPDTRLSERPGARPGSGGYEQSGAPWLRLLLELSGPSRRRARRDRTLTWVSLGRSSQADHLEVNLPIDEIRSHVRAAVGNWGASGDTNLALFEMLFPHEAKLDLDEMDNLHLLVDESTAWIPWEVVTGRDTDGKLLQPLSMRAGVLRQLKPREAERPRRNFAPLGKRALVIGDPPTSLPRLHGAATEAREVADLLERDGYEVERCIFNDDGTDDGDPEEVAKRIREAFFKHQYRVIHIAAHGVFEEGTTDPFASGVVIGDIAKGHLLTAQHFADRLVRPDLVFLNCCHIGRIDEPATQPASTRRYSDLAASMSIEIMRTGVRAVVAAGWAVDDTAAMTFARTFYASMIEGYAYGESVTQAREKCYSERNNTWGAYQCYGDPDFQFHGAPQKSMSDLDVVLSESHLVKRVLVLGKKAGDQVGRAQCAQVASELREIEDRYTDQFASAPVWEAFGSAYADAGAFDRAVLSYRSAMARGSNNAKAMEQLVNLEVRLAAMVNRGEISPHPGDFGHDGPDEEFPAILCQCAEERLGRLLQLEETAERLVIKGSLYKRWASIGGTGRDRAVDLRTSRDAYADAADKATGTSNALSVYHGCLAVQMAYLMEPGLAKQVASRSEPDDDSRRFVEYLSRLVQQREDMDETSLEGDYFSRAQPIDIRATEIIATGKIADSVDEIVEGFSAAFKVRSTARHRLSVKHHYRELEELLPDRPKKKNAHRDAARRIADALGDD